jgi:hypothetical protein
MTKKYTFAIRSSKESFDGFSVTFLAESEADARAKLAEFADQMQITQHTLKSVKPYLPNDNQ